MQQNIQFHSLIIYFFNPFNINISLLSQQEVCHEASEADNILKSIYLYRMLVLTCLSALRWIEMCENVALEYYYLCSSERESVHV